MDLNSKNHHAETPFHFICSANYFNIFEMMISNSDFFNFVYAAKDDKKVTGFHRACYFGCKEVVELIIRNSKSFDFDLTAQDWNGETGFQLANKNGYSNIFGFNQG